MLTFVTDKLFYSSFWNFFMSKPFVVWIFNTSVCAMCSWKL